MYGPERVKMCFLCHCVQSSLWLGGGRVRLVGFAGYAGWLVKQLGPWLVGWLVCCRLFCQQVGWLVRR